jgi:hypothetical protein
MRLHDRDSDLWLTSNCVGLGSGSNELNNILATAFHAKVSQFEKNIHALDHLSSILQCHRIIEPTLPELFICSVVLSGSSMLPNLQPPWICGASRLRPHLNWTSSTTLHQWVNCCSRRSVLKVTRRAVAYHISASPTNLVNPTNAATSQMLQS